MALDPTWLRSLDVDQRKAVTCRDQSICVAAGPGTGKTRTLASRGMHLVDLRSVSPENILVVTFAVRAAAEIRARLTTVLGPRARAVRVCTFHALGARILRDHGHLLDLPSGWTILDAAAAKALRIRIASARGVAAKQLARFIERSKRSLRTPEDALTKARESIRSTPRQRALARAYRDYQRVLDKDHMLDFSDLVSEAVRLLEAHPKLRTHVLADRGHLLIDELQDIDPVQLRLVQCLLGPKGNLFGVGDTHQMIYGWRGSDPRLIEKLDAHFEPTKLSLGTSYRLTGPMLNAAKGVLGAVATAPALDLHAHRPQGSAVEVHRATSPEAEAAWVAAQIVCCHKANETALSIGVLVRTKTKPTAETIRTALAEVGVPYIDTIQAPDSASKSLVYTSLRASVLPTDLHIEQTVRAALPQRQRKGLPPLHAHAARNQRPLWTLLREGNLPDLSRGTATAVKALLATLEPLVARAERSPSRVERFCTKLVDALNLHDDPTATRVRERARAYEASTSTPTLKEFVEQLALDSFDETPTGAVTLSTVHAAKGREFDVVFLPGMIDGWFPLRPRNASVFDEIDDEERRVAYVAFTRARTRLVLSHSLAKAVLRPMHVPSRWLIDGLGIPPPGAQLQVGTSSPSMSKPRPAHPRSTRRAAE